VLAVGEVDGSGILWDGVPVRYIGIRISGGGLLTAIQMGLLYDATWGTGILWDGEGSLKSVPRPRDLTFGSGILWDGGVAFQSGRTWSREQTWSSALVWPDNLAAQGVVAPLFGEPSMSGLATPVVGAPNPYPVRPDFGVE
jgi:hypothetical protein